MQITAQDIKILIAACQYLEKRGRLTKTLTHRIKMIEQDVNDNYGKSFLPSKARLKQMFHMMNELRLKDMIAFIKTVPHDMSVEEHIKKMQEYEIKTQFSYGDFPLIVREHANEFYKRLSEWYFKNEMIDGQMRHVQEIGMNLRIQE